MRFFLFAVGLSLSALVTADEPHLRSGDWTVSGEETVAGQHIRLDGSLILPAGAKLTLEHCTLEIVGDYSRQHSVEWQGGTLVTRHCTLGGFVNEAGTSDSYRIPSVRGNVGSMTASIC